MRKNDSYRLQIVDLLYQALETELGGVEVYRMALLCTDRVQLKEVWGEYLEQTEEHVTWGWGAPYSANEPLREVIQ